MASSVVTGEDLVDVEVYECRELITCSDYRPLQFAAVVQLTFSAFRLTEGF